MSTDNILIQNSFYPKGLTEADIMKYYVEERNNIIKETKNREIFFFFFIGKNDFVVKRKWSSLISSIILTNETYDKFINGRTVSIISTMNKFEQFGIIDIDSPNFKKAKQDTALLYDVLKDKFEKKIDILYTGKTSFHLYIPFDKKEDISTIRLNLRSIILKDNNILDNFSLLQKRQSDKSNIDLSPNKYRGGFITRYSLSTIGLKCDLVDRENLLDIKQSDFIIKK